MFIIMRKLIVFSYFFRVCLCFETVLDDFDGIPSSFAEVKEEEPYPNDSEVLNATMFKIVKKYYCRSDIEDGELLVYGTRSWTFPNQNVNLSLRYPAENRDRREDAEAPHDYILTGLKVVFHLSGSEGHGYITGGGMNQDHIRMVFLFQNITSLSYQFYLLGVPRSEYNVTENYSTRVNLC